MILALDNTIFIDNQILVQIVAQKLTKDAFWTNVDEERSATFNLKEDLMNHFGTKSVGKENQVRFFCTSICNLNTPRIDDTFP